MQCSWSQRAPDVYTRLAVLPARSLPNLQWRDLTVLRQLKAVAANRNGQVVALRDHVSALKAGASVWGVYEVQGGEAWIGHGGAKDSISGQAAALLCQAQQ